MLNNIINDLRNLEGKEVGKNTYFHNIYTNKANLNEISTIDILKNLRQYEITNFEIMNYMGASDDITLDVDFEEFCEIEEYEEVTSDNSYNWSAPLTNHINFSIYKSGLYDGIIVVFRIHRFGDVRWNYTEECYLKFEDEYEFYEILMENNRTFLIKDNDNNIEYTVTIDILNDCPTIEKETEMETEYIEGGDAYELLENIINNIENYKIEEL